MEFTNDRKPSSPISTRAQLTSRVVSYNPLRPEASNMKSLAVREPPLLRTASIVTRYCFPETCGELPHVTAQLDSFLNHFSGIWTIVTAYEHTKSLRWVKHFAAREPAETQDQFYRRWLLNRTAELAAWDGDLETIQWLMEKYLPEEHADFVASAAAARGHLDVLLWLHEHHRDRVCFGGLEMVEALRNDHEHIVKWLRENGHVDGRACKFSVLCAAANAGNLDIVKWVDNDGETQYKLYGQLPPAGFTLPRRNALAVLMYLASRDLGAIRPEMLLAAVSTGNFEVVKWLHSEQGLALRVEAMQAAAVNGHFDLIRWMFKMEPGIFDKSVVENAAKFGSLEIIQWTHDNWSGTLGMGVMDTAAHYGHLNLVKWLDYHTEGCSESAMDGAATNGHLEIVKWLHEHRSEGCRVFAMDSAAGNGRLNVVKWLHGNRSEGCSTKAMDEAARRGHLLVVKWLHQHRDEGCTTLAMNYAAQHGHLEVVKWLHSYRSEGCTVQAMDLAAKFGHINVVKWLHRHRKEGCTYNAMDGAAEFGHLHVVRWLHFNRKEGCSSAAMTNAILNGHFDVVMFLHVHRSEGCKFCEDLVRPTLRKAVASFFRPLVRGVALELQQWARRNYRDKVQGCNFLGPEFDWHSRCLQRIGG